jgi:hypothetical protein
VGETTPEEGVGLLARAIRMRDKWGFLLRQGYIFHRVSSI